jgi:hypothetical protein
MKIPIGGRGAERPEQFFTLFKRFFGLNTLAYVAVEPKLAAQYAVHQEGHTEGFDVNQVTILVTALHNGVARFSEPNLARKRRRFILEMLGRNQVVDRLSDHFVVPVTK